MVWNKKLLKQCKLYLILDAQVHDYATLLNVAKKSIVAGVDIIQLRDKFGSAKDILKFSEKILYFTQGRAFYIINDRVDLALASGVDGVHLGQDDLPIIMARKIVGKKICLGVSCQTLGQAKKAQEQGADYIGFGSVFKTLTKPNRHPMDLKLLARVYKQIRIPVFPIGGIDLMNLSRLQEIGIKRVAVCRAISTAKNIREATMSLRERLDERS
ncbi:Thiamin-phosphate pyrophosphorylase [hydrothermal vent metagenome]|uniref:thiamine phosphate synthase n=1 Tax=hydrothermal vent metagenome TaxID=652676 RepID=A0A3B1DRU6_9ZZZZ